MKYYKVKFAAKFEATVEVEEGESLEDAISDIDIPENAQCRYEPETFEPSNIVTDANGDEVNIATNPSD